MKFKVSVLFTVVLMICFSSGCFLVGKSNGIEENLAKAGEAISERDYELASHHAELVLNREPENTEAGIILHYVQYGDNMLIAAFWESDAEALRYLVKVVHDKYVKCPRFNTPVLVLAAAYEHTDMVEILLEAGVDPNKGTDTDGNTALMWACRGFDEKLEMARLLLEAGAEVNGVSVYGETALSLAQQFENPNIAALLREYGATE